MRKDYTIQVRGRNYHLGGRTWIMGVLNVTPDSFSDGGFYLEKEKAVKRGLELASEGADIIDVGGESTRPGSEPVSAEEEARRVLPVISALREKTEALISVDTTKSEVAEAALEMGADIINDISAFRFDSRMAALAAEKNVPVILMHMKGTPRTMQHNPTYSDLLQEVKSFLGQRIDYALSSGIKKEKIIIDPGIGFGKKHEHNLTLINCLSFLNELERPILVGPSRKSFIGKILHLPPQERTEGTIASAIITIIRGAHIIRVHDVSAVKKAVLVADAILGENNSTRDEMKKKESYVF
ncbi:MAG: dihydropteroate synthase [Candidatus Aminicenantales bacterium]